MNYVIVRSPNVRPRHVPIEMYHDGGFTEMFARAHVFQDRLTAETIAGHLRHDLNLRVTVVPAEIALEHLFWVRMMWNEQ